MDDSVTIWVDKDYPPLMEAFPCATEPSSLPSKRLIALAFPVAARSGGRRSAPQGTPKNRAVRRDERTQSTAALWVNEQRPSIRRATVDAFPY